MPARDSWFRPAAPDPPPRPDHLQLLRPRAPLPAPPLPGPATGCPICRGAGFLRPAVPVGHPEFGTLQPCACRRPDPAAQRLSQSNLAALADATLARWDAAVPGAGPALAQARAYAQAPAGGLLIEGGVGAGKTHLAAAIGHAALAAGQTVYFSAVPDLLDRLYAALDPAQEPPDWAEWARLHTVELLILDDLNPWPVPAWVEDRLAQVLDTRLIRRLPTVVTTYGAWEQCDPRLASRLHDPALVQHLALTTGDYRRRAPQPGLTPAHSTPAG